MARRGTFGKLPPAAPSLGRELLAISREMQAERDKNIMDAWKNGGMFEGKKVTDEMILAYWRDRLANVDQKDPLYDTYRNAIMQYEYAIAESKIATRYAQGKVSDRAMAQFYLDWAEKVPKRSEFYRVLQRDAAQFMRAAQARSSTSGAQAKEKAYQDAQAATEARYEKAGQYLTDVFTAMAKANALIGMDDNENLTSFDPSDPAVMMQLITAINQPGAVLYHDGLTGKAVTGAEVTAKLKQLDPDFSGQVSQNYYGQALRRQLQGQAIRLERAEKTGHATDVRNIMGWQEYTSELGRQSNAWPVEQSYMDARAEWLRVWTSPTATPDSKIAAWNKYAARLTSLANETDDATRARLLAEASGNGNVSSLAEDFTGLGSPDHTTTGEGPRGDIADTHFDVQRYIAMQEAVASGTAIWTMGVTNKDGIFVPTPGGREVGAASPQDVLAASPVAAVPVIIPQAGASPITVWAPGIAVSAVARDANGQPLSSFAQPGGNTANAQVASAFDITVNGRTTRIFSYTGADGRTYYTNDAPWSNQVIMRDTPSGIVLDVSAFVPASGDPATMTNKPGSPFYVDPDNGKLTFNPTTLVFATDPVRTQAGPDPWTDYFSPTLAAIMAQPEAINTLTELGKDPAFRAQIDREARIAAGQTQDLETGQWVGGDQAAYDRFNAQSLTMMNSQSAVGLARDVIGTVFRLFRKDTTAPTFKATVPSRGEQEIDGVTPKLPSDTVRGTPFDAVGLAFKMGTNLLDSFFGGDKAPLSIKVEGQIKTPAPPPLSPLAAKIAPPTPTVQPVSPNVSITTTPPPSVTTVGAPNIGSAPTKRSAFGGGGSGFQEY